MKTLVRWLILFAPALFLLLLSPLNHQTAVAQGQSVARPIVRTSIKNDQSPPLRSLKAKAPTRGENKVIPWRIPPVAETKKETGDRDPVIQSQSGDIKMPTPSWNFDGMSNEDNVQLIGTRVAPPDTNGDIGANHYVQWVNLTLAIWEIDRSAKTATRVFGPAPGNILWAGFGGVCETLNSGDPIVLYDSSANRWMASQPAWDFAVNPHTHLHACPDQNLHAVTDSHQHSSSDAHANTHANPNSHLHAYADIHPLAFHQPPA